MTVKLPIICANARRNGTYCRALQMECEPFQENEAAVRACASFAPIPARGEARTVALPQIQSPCVHLGKDTGELVPCTSCGGAQLKVFECAIHDRCTIAKPGEGVEARCEGCRDKETTRQATPVAGAIPKVFHRVWLGKKQMPRDFEDFGKQWLELHPGWEMYTWTDKNLGPLRVGDIAAWHQAPAHSQRSDVIRFLALNYYGGVYVDTDVEPVKNIEPLLRDQTFVAGREDESTVCTAVIASVPRHPVMQRAIRELSGGIPEGAPKSWTGPPVLTKATKGQQASILPPEVFYPYHWREPERRGEAFPDAYAVHHWAGSWIGAKEWWPRRYASIHGWFDYEAVYDAAIARARDGDTFVEVGSWMGKSAAYMALKIRASGKRIKLVCVDPWKWTAEADPAVPVAHEAFKSYGGLSMREIFAENIAACDVTEFVKPMQMTSVEAAKRFANRSVAFAFIDGDHEDAAADIAAWWPKIKPGGALAGHDVDMPAVARDVKESGLAWEPVDSRCWIARRP